MSVAAPTPKRDRRRPCGRGPVRARMHSGHRSSTVRAAVRLFRARVRAVSWLAFTCFASLSAAAPTSAQTTAEGTAAQGTAAEGIAAEGTAAPPEGAEALAQRLRARHARDLPRAESLRAPEALVRLRWLAERHRLLLVRARALLLLAGDPSPESRAVVLRVLDSNQAALVRAAALRATSSWPLDRDLRVRLERLAAEADPRLHGPARARLAATE